MLALESSETQQFCKALGGCQGCWLGLECHVSRCRDKHELALSTPRVVCTRCIQCPDGFYIAFHGRKESLEADRQHIIPYSTRSQSRDLGKKS